MIGGTSGSSWPRATPVPRAPRLLPEHVHVWCADLDRPPIDAARLLAVLSDEERRGVEQRPVPIHRARGIASRGLLRWLLAGYLGLSPRDVPVRPGPHGKPELPRTDLHFNVSHADDLVLYAVGRADEVGIDVERLHAMPRAAAIAARFFSPAEVRALEQVAAAARDEAFLRLWTRKEAYVKGRGEGLALPFERFDLLPVREGDLYRVADHADRAAVWTVHTLWPRPGFVGAVAAPGEAPRIEAREWVA